MGIKARGLAYFCFGFLSMNAWADSGKECKTYSFLTHGFSQEKYSQCEKLIHQCPMRGPLLDSSCVDRVVKNNVVCHQAKKLAQVLNMPLSVITVKPVAQFEIIDVKSIADGQDHYYLISPQGCMVDTIIDPRQLDFGLQSKYKNKTFLIVNAGQPIYQMMGKGLQRFEVSLKVTDTCLACSVIGLAKVNYNFTSSGQLIKVTLQSFTAGSMTR